MFNGLPANIEDKVQANDLFVQKRIYQALKLLNLLPINQNEVGLFTNYLHGSVEVSNPMYTNNGIHFNEIKFGKGQTVGGQTLPLGFMYPANTRDKQRGQYESNLQTFLNTAVVKIADFYEEKYINALISGGRASTSTLKAWTSASNILENENIIDDEMRYDTEDNSTGYTPNTVLVSRKDKLKITTALQKEDYTPNYEYIASHKLNDGEMVFFDKLNPGASIEKYADPEYNILQSLADDGITMTEDGEVLPKGFINLKEAETNKPQVVEYYIWAESNLNIKNSNGFLTITN